jgi:tetratricopeptide (TPR) repeat protein
MNLPLRFRRCAACLLLAPFTSQLMAQDTITLDRSARAGSKIVGKITDVSPTEITVTSSGSERKVPVNQVQRISLAGEPAALRQARSAVLSGQYEQALESLAGLTDADAKETVLRQEIGFYRIFARAQLALLGGGDPKAAEAEMKAFAARERTTFHFYEIAELLGDLAQASGDYAGAAGYYGYLARAPWPDYELRSNVLLAGALRSQGKLSEAITQYDRALAVNASDPVAVRQQTLARIGKAACQAQQGHASAAIAELEGVITKNDPADERVFAQAYLALGTAYQQADQTLDAVLAYLHIDLLFYGQREAHAEALYNLTELWPKVDQPARAVESRQLLQSRYAGTIWAKRAG